MMKEMVKKIRFSVGVQISVLLTSILFCFIFFAAYNYQLLTRLNNRYAHEIGLYSDIISLKKDFHKCDTRLTEYIKTGNRAPLAEFNDLYEDVTEKVDNLYRKAEDEEARYLLNSIHRSFEAYYGECANASYLYSIKNSAYFNRVDETGMMIQYLEGYADELLEYTLNMSIETKEEVEKRQSVTIFWNMALAALACICIVWGTIYIRKSMIRPVHILFQQAVEVASGNLDVKPNGIKSTNDIGVLAETFDQMCESIRNKIQAENEKMDAEKRLILEQKKNVEVEKLLEETRFLALQSQTNPHFLFNTLNSINRTIMFGRNEQAMMMLDSLADLLRYNLTDANIPADLGQELSITEKYLNIQKLRFSDRIHVKESIQEELCSQVALPKFTLQPLVENAIIHGLEPKTGGGTITIDVRKRRGECLIRIADDGMGMTKECLEAVRKGMQEKTSKRIGVRNTCQRVQYFTGREDSFRIFSKQGAGTMVVIRLPLLEGEEWGKTGDNV